MNEETEKILLVEDDAKTAEFVSRAIRDAGYGVVWAADGLAGLEAAEKTPFDLAVVDIMLPKLDGFGVIAGIRKAKLNLPVIVLSAKSSAEDKVRGLEGGADDYLSKPFSPAELIARIQAHLRRANTQGEAEELVFEDLRVNVISRRAYRGGERIWLQPLEFQLLEYLMRNKGKIVSKTTIMEHVWEYHFDPHTNIVESRMSRLRDKVDKPYDRKLIHTVRGFGYVLE